MAQIEDMLIEDERKLGQYNVELPTIASTGDWTLVTMPMIAYITNFRLILKPNRKRFEPASIPGYYIKSIDTLELGRFDCVVLTLKTNHKLNLFFGTQWIDEVVTQLEVMHLPPPKYQLDRKIPHTDISRLIEFLEAIAHQNQSE